MNVLILDNSNKVTGALKSILNVTSDLKKVNFIIATPSKSNFEFIEKHGHKAINIRFTEIQKNWKLLIYLPMLLLNSIRVLRLMRRNEIEILHVNDLYNMVGILVKVLNPKIKLIYHVRLLPDSYVSILYSVWRKLISRFADRLILVSNAVSNHFSNSESKIVIYDGAHVPELGAGTVVDDVVKFFYPANYIPGKGHLYAIKAFSTILNDIPNSLLEFIGGDLGRKSNKLYKKLLIEKVKEMALEDRVIFNDFAYNLNDKIKSSHIVLMFSESESFSMICIEAGLCKKPVIATKCGGPSEIIMHGETGWLVENRDVYEMSRSMKLLYDDHILREKLGNNAYKRCIEQFSVKKASISLYDVYQSTIKM